MGEIRDRQVWALGFFWSLILLMLSMLMIPVPGWAAHLQEQLDEWNFLRTHFDARGVTLETVNTTDIGSDVNSEGRNKALVIGDIDLLLTLDTEKLVNWKGGTVFLYGLGLYGGNIATSQATILGNSLKPGINKTCLRKGSPSSPGSTM
jgi:hypothetical protein